VAGAKNRSKLIEIYCFALKKEEEKDYLECTKYKVKKSKMPTLAGSHYLLYLYNPKDGSNCPCQIGLARSHLVLNYI
jgi:hypothetical protein